MPAMSTKSRQTIYGGAVIGANIWAEGARKRAAQAVREADRAEAEAWSLQMEAWKLEAALKCRSCKKAAADPAHDQVDRNAGDRAFTVRCIRRRRGESRARHFNARTKNETAVYRPSTTD
jgi:mono/diheme cytochrome c family protein